MSGRQMGWSQPLDLATTGALENGKPLARLGELAFFEGATFRFLYTDEALSAGMLLRFTVFGTTPWLVNKMPTTQTQACAGFANVATTTTNTHFWAHVSGLKTSKSPSLIAASGTLGEGLVGDTSTAGSVKDGTLGGDDGKIVATCLLAAASSAITQYLARMAY